VSAVLYTSDLHIGHPMVAAKRGHASAEDHDRALREIFGHRHAIRRSISGASRAKDKLFNATFDRCVEQLKTIDDIVMEVFLRVRHRFRHQGTGSEVHDRLGLSSSNCIEDVVFPFGLAEDKTRARIHCGAMAFGQIIIDSDFMAGIKQFLRANRPDVTGPAGDENVHAA